MRRLFPRDRQVLGGQQGRDVSDGRAIPFACPFRQLFPRHEVGARLGLDVAFCAVGPSGFGPLSNPSAMLEHGEAFDLARSERGDPLVGIAATVRHDFVAEGLELVRNAHDVLDARVAKVEGLVDERVVAAFLAGIRTVDAVSHERRFGQVGYDVGGDLVVGLALVREQLGRCGQKRSCASRAVQRADKRVPHELLFRYEPCGQRASVSFRLEAGVRLTGGVYDLQELGRRQCGDGRLDCADVPLVGINGLTKRVVEVLARRVAVAELGEAVLQCIRDDHHDVGVFPPASRDEADLVLQAPDGQDGEQRVERRCGRQRLVSRRFSFHVVRDADERIDTFRMLIRDLLHLSVEFGDGPFALARGRAPAVVDGERWAEALEGGHRLVAAQRVQPERVGAPYRERLEQGSGVHLPAGFDDAVLVGGEPVVRVEEQTIDGRLRSAS